MGDQRRVRSAGEPPGGARPGDDPAPLDAVGLGQDAGALVEAEIADATGCEPVDRCLPSRPADLVVVRARPRDRGRSRARASRRAASRSSRRGPSRRRWRPRALPPRRQARCIASSAGRAARIVGTRSGSPPGRWTRSAEAMRSTSSGSPADPPSTTRATSTKAGRAIAAARRSKARTPVAAARSGMPRAAAVGTITTRIAGAADTSGPCRSSRIGDLDIAVVGGSCARLPRRASRDRPGGGHQQRIEEGLVAGEVLAAAVEPDGPLIVPARAGQGRRGPGCAPEPGTAR